MEQEERLKIISAVLEHFGAKTQVIKAMEEMAELQVHLAKWVNGEKYSAIGVIEELGDVTVMLHQLYEIFDKDALIEKIVNFKLHKMSEKIKGGSSE